MKYSLKEILDLAESKECAIPAFNVYNLEILMGVVSAVKETGAPVILQMYSRLFNTQTGKLLSPVIKDVMNDLKTPVAFHLDHGAVLGECVRAMRYGATGIMIDASTLTIEDNIKTTKNIVNIAKEASVSVEGELGHVGSVMDKEQCAFTEVSDAVKFVDETGVDALAIMVGTAHGKYTKAPVLGIERITEIHKSTNAHLVLHGGSGIPDDQIKSSIKAGIRKINFATDVCYAFVESFKSMDPYHAPLDVVMAKASEAVKDFAIEKIHLLGADNF